MKRQNITTLILCAAVLLALSLIFNVWNQPVEKEKLSVGFLYENDVSTPATWNFALAEDALRDQLGDRVQVYTYSNVLASEVEDPIRNLAQKGCEIIFTNSHSELIAALAVDFPGVQFCQVSFEDTSADTPENYHTMNGEIAQGRYACGVAAGMKLRELLDAGTLPSDQALVGYLCAYDTPDALSGASAFMLGVLSEAPEARMRLRLTQVWGNYTVEKNMTQALIDEGCVIIAQHTNTIGPALACEQSWPDRPAYLFSLHRSMQDVAPASAVTGVRVNYIPYVLSAVQAQLSSQPIETVVSGSLHGARDLSAGFEQGWVDLLDLNQYLAAEGTQKRLNQLISSFRAGGVRVFQGPYTAVNPEDPSDTLDLTTAFLEYSDSSYPAFHYLLQDYMTLE